MREIELELGGIDGFYTLFGLHYCGMFANPRMSVLFDTRSADTNVCALDHGKRVAAVLLDRNHGSNYYKQLRRPSSFIS